VTKENLAWGIPELGEQCPGSGSYGTDGTVSPRFGNGSVNNWISLRDISYKATIS
jgi:hypothetical protein